MTFEVRAIREEERATCLQLWQTVWPGDNHDAYFGRYFYGDVEWLPYYTIVCLEAEQIVSAVQICKRTVPCGDYLLTMGGIANVATLPEHRGKGYNSACLKKAIEVMEADAMDFSLLFTGINDYYARFGYANTPRTHFRGVLKPHVPAPRDPLSLTVRAATPEDLPAIFDIYSAFNAHRPLSVQRTEAYWSDWIGISVAKIPDSLYVATDAAGVAGYALLGKFRSAADYNPEEAEARIIEYGARRAALPSESEAIACALIGFVANLMTESQTRNLIADVPSDTALDFALNHFLKDRETRTSGASMMRLLHRTNLLKSLTFGMNELWTQAGRPTGKLTIETPYGDTLLDATGTLIQIAETDAPQGTRLTHSQFLQALFGMIEVADAFEGAPETALLRALFPKRHPIFWGQDGF